MELSQKSLTGIQKFFLFQVPMNMQKDWKAKLESAYSFMLKYSKITVRIVRQQEESAASWLTYKS